MTDSAQRRVNSVKAAVKSVEKGWILGAEARRMPG
jgi:hypothetical protein